MATELTVDVSQIPVIDISSLVSDNRQILLPTKSDKLAATQAFFTLLSMV